MLVLVALVIISFAMIPLFSSFQGSRMGVEKSIHHLIAANLITTQLEAFRARPFREIDEYLLGFRGVPKYLDVVNGPFETQPERPDVIEKSVYRSGDVTFDRYSFLSYFPRHNPSPEAPDHWLQRQRIRVRCDVLWSEAVKDGQPRQLKLSAATMLHNEVFNPQPGGLPPEDRTADPEVDR